MNGENENEAVILSQCALNYRVINSPYISLSKKTIPPRYSEALWTRLLLYRVMTPAKYNALLLLKAQSVTVSED